MTISGMTTWYFSIGSFNLGVAASRALDGGSWAFSAVLAALFLAYAVGRLVGDND